MLLVPLIFSLFLQSSFTYSLLSNIKSLRPDLSIRMGGNSFVKTGVARLSLETFNKVKTIVQHDLQNYFKTDICFHMPEKVNFGDVDIIYIPAKEHGGLTMSAVIQQIFNPREIVISGDVLSFTYFFEETCEFYQVDMILVEDLEMGKFYYSYGDLGNLVGHMTDKLGIKFGINGLYVYLHNRILEDRGIEFGLASANRQKIILNDCPKEICEFLEMDFTAWGRFKTDTEVFEWIKTCKMFNKDTFRDGASNHRKKNIRRKMYSSFCDTIESANDKLTVTGSKEVQDDTVIVEQQLSAIEYFGKQSELDLLIQDCKDKYRVATERKKKFNAKKFLAYGIENRNLGEAMLSFKENIMARYDPPNFEHWLDNSDCDQVDVSLADFFKKDC